MGARFVVLGLALPRSTWFRSVAQWTHSASLPIEFVKVASPAELRAHLASGRRFSALLVDGGIPHLDRDLFDEARVRDCAVIVVDDLRVHRDWAALGVDRVVNPVFDRQSLLDVLEAHATEVPTADALPSDIGVPPEPAAATALVAMVCGSGGTGTSTASIALAQGLAVDARYAGAVLLADLARRADQAMLHDAPDVVPGVQELVEAHRSSRLSVGEAIGFTFEVVERRYRLLLGLRRPRNWVALRPRAFSAMLDTLETGWNAVVCDTDAELEGEADVGSTDVEDRNVMARTVAARADVAVVVGVAGMKGVHSLVRTVADLVDHGVPADRVLTVVNRAPKSPRARREVTEAMTRLSPSGVQPAASPIFLPEADVDHALLDGVRLADRVVLPLTNAVLALSRAVGPRPSPSVGAVAVTPGSLGSWSEAGIP